jgi:hypothetical protein
MSARTGVLTGGGDGPGLNAVIRAVAPAAAKRGCETVGFLGGYAGILEPHQTPRDCPEYRRPGSLLGEGRPSDPLPPASSATQDQSCLIPVTHAVSGGGSGKVIVTLKRDGKEVWRGTRLITLKFSSGGHRAPCYEGMMGGAHPTSLVRRDTDYRSRGRTG